jgi:hypothetical protein
MGSETKGRMREVLSGMIVGGCGKAVGAPVIWVRLVFLSTYIRCTECVPGQVANANQRTFLFVRILLSIAHAHTHSVQTSHFGMETGGRGIPSSVVERNEFNDFENNDRSRNQYAPV